MNTDGVRHVTERDAYGALLGPFRGLAKMQHGSLRYFASEEEFAEHMRGLRIPSACHGAQGPQGYYPVRDDIPVEGWYGWTPMK